MKKKHWEREATSGKYSGSLGPSAPYRFAFKQKNQQKILLDPARSPQSETPLASDRFEEERVDGVEIV